MPRFGEMKPIKKFGSVFGSSDLLTLGLLGAVLLDKNGKHLIHTTRVEEVTRTKGEITKIVCLDAIYVRE